MNEYPVFSGVLFIGRGRGIPSVRSGRPEKAVCNQ